MYEPRPDDIYTSLSALVRLRFAARGFSYLPRQPVRSILSGQAVATAGARAGFR